MTSRTFVIPKSVDMYDPVAEAADRAGFKVRRRSATQATVHVCENTGVVVFYRVSKATQRTILASFSGPLRAYAIPGGLRKAPPHGGRHDFECLTQRIAWNPEDLFLRERYAEAVAEVDPARSRFVMLQLGFEHTPRTADPDAHDRAKLHEARQLLVEHRGRWEGALHGFTSKCVFRRGFVELVHLKAGAFIDLGALVIRIAPIQHLDIDGLSESEYKPFFDCTELRRIRSLSLAGSRVTDRAIESLAESTHLGTLRWLSLRNNPVTARSVAALARSRRLPELRWVDLRGTLCPINEIAELSGGQVWTREPDELRSMEDRLGERIPWLRFPAPPQSWADLSPDRFRLRAPSSPAYIYSDGGA